MTSGSVRPRTTRPRWFLRPGPVLAFVTMLLLLQSLDPGGVSITSVGQNGAAGPHKSTLAAPVTSPLAISSFTASLPVMDQGQVTYLNLTASGGAPPYTYRYYGLPAGCLSQNLSSLLCYPTEAETFTITAVVNDTAGASVDATTSLVVKTGYGGPPIINLFYASPETVSIDTKVLIYANATSSSSTPTQNLKFGYLDLPPGCAGFNQTILQCVPTAPGTFHLYLLVTDGFGAFASSRAWLNVTGGNTSTSVTPVISKTMEEWFAVGAVAFVIVIAAILVIPRGRRRSPPVKPWNS